MILALTYSWPEQLPLLMNRDHPIGPVQYGRNDSVWLLRVEYRQHFSFSLNLSVHLIWSNAAIYYGKIQHDNNHYKNNRGSWFICLRRPPCKWNLTSPCQDFSSLSWHVNATLWHDLKALTQRTMGQNCLLIRDDHCIKPLKLGENLIHNKRY